MVKTNTEPKRDILKCSKKFLSHNICMVENYTKDLKKSVYHGAVVSALAVCYILCQAKPDREIHN